MWDFAVIKLPIIIMLTYKLQIEWINGLKMVELPVSLHVFSENSIPSDKVEPIID